MEKKVPDSIICGNPNKFIHNGIEVSLFTILLKISPTPHQQEEHDDGYEDHFDKGERPMLQCKFRKK